MLRTFIAASLLTAATALPAKAVQIAFVTDPIVYDLTGVCIGFSFCPPASSTISVTYSGVVDIPDLNQNFNAFVTPTRTSVTFSEPVPVIGETVPGFVQVLYTAPTAPGLVGQMSLGGFGYLAETSVAGSSLDLSVSVQSGFVSYSLRTIEDAGGTTLGRFQGLRALPGAVPLAVSLPAPEVIPAPAALPLLLGAVGALGLLRRRIRAGDVEA